ncbi:MAG: outer membrane protein, partial [Xanthobacteraceae bacterium]
VQEFFSAWYLRLDGGYRFNGITSGDAFGSSFFNNVLKNSGSIGGGVGYKYGWFRADFTGDYGTRPDFLGDTVSGQHVTAKLTNATMLLNGYIDMGSWWGATPYIGGGIGYSYLQPANFTVTPPVQALAADSRWVPSWALMAGVSYAVSPILLLDASYRYLDIGESRSLIGLTGTEVKFGNWTAQEVRIGLRYLIP